MRATLLEVNARITPLLVRACQIAGLPLTRVSTLSALLSAAGMAHRGDLVILDCSLEQRADAARYQAVVQQVMVPVQVIHTSETFRRALRRLETASTAWLPANIGWLDLLDSLETLQYQAYATQLERMHWVPTAQQRAVLALLGAALANQQIAATLHIRPGTVKTHVKRLMEKFAVNTIEELQAIHRLGILEGRKPSPQCATRAWDQQIG